MVTKAYLFHLIVLYVLLLLHASGQAQQIIPELTIDFDQSDLDKVVILPITDLDGSGVFGINNGSFEITDSEGTECPNPFPNTNGLNDNSALLISAPFLLNYCEVSFTVEVSLSDADFENCASPNTLSPIGCTGFGGSEPGADGFVLTILHQGQEVIKGGYCGSTPEGSFQVDGLNAQIGDVYTVMIMGGTQAPDESYFIKRILVEGIPQSPVPPEIVGDSEYCQGQGAIVLNVIPQGGSNYVWFKDGVSLNNDGNSSYIKALPNAADAGRYTVDFSLPEGCPVSSTLDLIVNQCVVEDPIFNLAQTYCANESLDLPITSDNSITGSWNVPRDFQLNNSTPNLVVEFIPDNGGMTFIDTLEIFSVYSDTLIVSLCPDGSYDINGNGYTALDAGRIVEERFSSIQGCDSIIFIDIIELTTDYLLFDDAYCNDDTLMINGSSYYFGNSIGIDTFVNAAGCDSIVEIDIDFRTPLESNIFSLLCPDDVLAIAGEIYDINNPKGTSVLTTPEGCDSMVTVDLSFIEPDTLMIEVSLCPGDIEIFRGIEVDRDFDPNLYFNFGPNGCDSLVSFIINPVETVETLLQDSICPNDFIEVNGSRYDADKLFGSEVLVGVNGCDSIVNIDLQLNKLDSTVITGIYCESQSFTTTVNGVVYDIDNPIGQEVLINQNGCDSILLIDLMIQPTLIGEEGYDGCQGDGYELIINGAVYNEERPQGTEILLTDQGCDSIVSVSLNFSPNSLDTITYLGCQGDGFSITVDGFIYDELIPRGQQRYTNTFGCDSIVAIDLLFQPPIFSEVNYLGCIGDNFSVMVAGDLYDELNPTGVETLVSSSGCDSIVLIELIYNSSSRTEETYIGCQNDGYSINVNGVFYNESNSVGQEVLTNVAGCDSIVDISLQFEMISTDTLEYLGCLGDGFELIVGGNSYDEITPNGLERLLSTTGCDSIVTIELTYLEPVVSDLLYAGCASDGYFVEVNDQRYDEMNPFGVETLLGSNGCDSVVMIDFVYTSLDTAYLNELICARNGASRFINGTVYDQGKPSGVEVFTSATGCDSVVVVDLEFTEVITFDLTDTLCFGSSIIVDGNTYSANNPIGSERILLANGCDSIINVSLSFVDPVKFTISIDTLVQNESYQLEIIEVALIETIEWTSSGLDCMECTDPVLTTNENTTISVQVNDIYGCSTLIELPIIIDQSLPNIYVPNALSPNSVTGNNKIRPVLPQGVSATYDLMIYDRWGGIIYHELQTNANDENAGWDGRFNNAQVSQGVYIYSMTIYMSGLDRIEMIGSVTVF